MSSDRPLEPSASEDVTERDAGAPAAGDRRGRLLRVALLVGGTLLLGWLIHDVGAARVLATALAAAPWMPLVIAFDLGFFACEAMAHRAVLGPARASIPWSRFVRSSFLYFCVLAIAPLGRAGAEIARAASFAPHVGGGRATAAGVNVQAGVLLANLAISIPCAVAVAATVGVQHPLAWLLMINGAATGVLAGITLLVIRRSRIGRWVGARFPRLARAGADLDEAVVAPRRDLARSTFWCCAARVVQIGQYAALLAAIDASVSVRGTLVALGVHLVGAGFGDLVPNQVGVLEGAYRIFADAVGLAHDPARAISIALLARVSQLLIAATGIALLALWPGAGRPGIGGRGANAASKRRS
jgi:hypothetical protein